MIFFFLGCGSRDLAGWEGLLWGWFFLKDRIGWCGLGVGYFLERF